MNRQKLSTFIILIPDGEGFNALPIFFDYLTHSPAHSQRERGKKGNP
jgi:hypothetical protein